MESFIETAPAWCLTFQDDGTLLYINRTCADLLGYEAGDLIGTHINALLPMAGRIFYQTHFFPLLKLHGKVDEIYLTLRTAQEEALPVLINAVRIKRDGKTVNDAALMPIRRRNEFEEELIRAKRAAEEACRARDEANLFLTTDQDRTGSQTATTPPDERTSGGVGDHRWTYGAKKSSYATGAIGGLPRPL